MTLISVVDVVPEADEAPATISVKRGSALMNQVAPDGMGRASLQVEDSIPVKGTLISAGFVVLMIVMNIISIGLKMDDLTRTLIIKLITELFRALRCPVIAFVTYKARKNKGARIPD